MATLKLSVDQLKGLIPQLVNQNQNIINQIQIKEIDYVYVFYVVNPIRNDQRQVVGHELLKQAFFVYRTGQVAAYGTNDRGILSIGETDRFEQGPQFVCSVQALSSLNITQFASGQYHALALTKNGEVYAWGKNDWGQLGVSQLGSDITEFPTAMLVEFLNPENEARMQMKAVACGDDFSLALAEDGFKVFLWGRNHCNLEQITLNRQPETPIERLSTPTPIIVRDLEKDTIFKVFGSEKSHYLQTTSGRLFSRGSNLCIELGHGDETDLVLFDYDNMRMSQFCPEKEICAAIASDSSLWAWGAFRDQPINQPRQIEFSRREAKLIPVDGNVAIMINMRETRLVRGRHQRFPQKMEAREQIGPLLPVIIKKGRAKVMLKVAKLEHVDFLGSAEQWFEERRLLSKITQAKFHAINQRFHPYTKGNTKFGYQFHAGITSDRQYLIVRNDDQVFGYGSNDHGILATGDREPVLERDPVRIQELCGMSIIDFASSLQHVLALTSQSHVFSWGMWNRFGQLGRVTETDEDVVPQRVNFGSDDVRIKKVACGQWFSVALAQDEKTVYAWGHNAFGQLGNETQHDSFEPRQVQLQLDASDSVKEIYPGRDALMILTKAGQLFACGQNEYGTIGIGGQEEAATRPVRVRFEPESTMIEMAVCVEDIAAAVDKEGKLWAWGGFEPNHILTPQVVPFDEPIVNLMKTVEDIVLITEREEVYLIKGVDEPLQVNKLVTDKIPCEALLADQTLSIKIEIVDFEDESEESELDIYKAGTSSEEASTSQQPTA